MYHSPLKSFLMLCLCTVCADTSLQRKVLLLLEHLSHSANLSMTCRLAQRACSAIQQRRRQQQHPLPICAPTSIASSEQQPHQHGQAPCEAATGSSAGLGAQEPLALGSSSTSQPAEQRHLREACRVVRDSSTFIRPSWSGGGSSSSSATSGLGNSVTSSADAAAGLAGSTLRLLKLLSLPVLDLSAFNVGSMINKGAFSEVLAATVSTSPAKAFSSNNSCRCWTTKWGLHNKQSLASRELCGMERVLVAVDMPLDASPALVWCCQRYPLCRPNFCVPVCTQI